MCNRAPHRGTSHFSKPNGSNIAEPHSRMQHRTKGAKVIPEKPDTHFAHPKTLKTAHYQNHATASLSTSSCSRRPVSRHKHVRRPNARDARPQPTGIKPMSAAPHARPRSVEDRRGHMARRPTFAQDFDLNLAHSVKTCAWHKGQCNRLACPMRIAA